jgi:peptide/nickel transport system permease protein
VVDPVLLEHDSEARQARLTARAAGAMRAARSPSRARLPRFIARRIVHGFLVVFGVLTIVFLITHAIGDPAELALPADAPVALVDAMRHTLGLDQPLLTQYWAAVQDWLRGDFGVSTSSGASALPLALNGLSKTLYLAAVTLTIAVPTALVLGVSAGLRPGSLVDRLVAWIAALGTSIASFWLGLVLILVFAVNLHWLPSNGYGGPAYVVMPAIALSLKPLGRVAQMTRASVAEELSKDYVKAARARGLSETRLAVAHIFKNAAAPILTLIGDEVASLMNGAIVIETVFSWPGIGRLLISSISSRDLPVIVACVAVIATVVIVVNLLVDIAYPLLDPRIRN